MGILEWREGWQGGGGELQNLHSTGVGVMGFVAFISPLKARMMSRQKAFGKRFKEK